MSVALDVIIVAILAGCVMGAYKSGFLKTLIDMVGTVASLVIAYFLASPVGNYINNTLIRPAFISSFKNVLEKNGVELSGDSFANIVNESPEFLNNILSKFNTTLEAVTSKISSASSTFVEDFVDAAVSPVSNTISYVISFIVIFIICSILISIVAKIAGFANKIPLIGGLNKTLGIVLGILNGLLVVFVMVFIFSSIVPYLQSLSNSPIDADIINNTWIYKYFDLYNPISTFINK